MKRRLLGACVLLSLLVGAVCSILWPMEVFWRMKLGSGAEVFILDGYVGYVETRDPRGYVPPESYVFWGRLGVYFERVWSAPEISRRVMVSLSYPTVGAMLLPLLWLVWRKGWHYSRTNACKTCGYDLRGSTGETCPECGASRIRKPARS